MRKWKHADYPLQWNWTSIRNRPLLKRRRLSDREERDQIHSSLTHDAAKESKRIHHLLQEIDARADALQTYR